MTIPNMEYVVANRYNVIFVSLSMIQSLNIFPLRTKHQVTSLIAE